MLDDRGRAVDAALWKEILGDDTQGTWDVGL